MGAFSSEGPALFELVITTEAEGKALADNDRRCPNGTRHSMEPSKEDRLHSDLQHISPRTVFQAFLKISACWKGFNSALYILNGVK
jgi:hypothetical protein